MSAMNQQQEFKRRLARLNAKAPAAPSVELRGSRGEIDPKWLYLAAAGVAVAMGGLIGFML